jgi:hypothetical protein
MPAKPRKLRIARPDWIASMYMSILIAYQARKPMSTRY